MKKKRSRAIITWQDFEFYVVYERYGGYKFHNRKYLQKRAKEDLKCECVKGGRFKQTEWIPITRSDFGAASVKYCGTLTWNGLNELIENACLYTFVRNTMGILDDNGIHKAISLERGWDCGHYCTITKEDELRRIFKKDYFDGIHTLQNYENADCYVSVQVKESRIREAIRTAYGTDLENLNEEQQKWLAQNIERYNLLCDCINDYIEKLANDERDVEPDQNAFVVDFRECYLDFKKAV